MSTDPATNSENDAASNKQLSVLQTAPIMAKRSLVVRTMDRVVPSKSKFLGLTWFLSVIGVIALFGNIQGESNQFYGIVESQLRSISFQYPVEIVDIPVVEGQRVERNARMLEVRRYDLDVNRLVLDEQINKIKAEHTATRHSVKAEISSLAAEQQAQIESFNTRIDSLETRHQLNEVLLESISNGAAGNSQAESPLKVKIRGLKAEKKQVLRMFQARIELQKQKFADISGPGDARIAELKKQKNELLRQSEALVVLAPFSGSVGSVMFKQGEQVDAFNPVISVQGNSTQHIKGYIHEAVSNNIQMGQTVWIKPLGASRQEHLVRGTVESLGSRIVEYPERLKRNPLVTAWGREAIINTHPGNKILQGEKVAIFLQRPQPLASRVAIFLNDYLPIAAVQALNRLDLNLAIGQPREIRIQIEEFSANQIEASGLVWNPDSQSFLLVSDEQSALFELTSNGRIVRQYSLDSIGKISDLESISRDGDNYYLAASLSHNKDKKLKSKRRKLCVFGSMKTAFLAVNQSIYIKCYRACPAIAAWTNIFENSLIKQSMEKRLISKHMLLSITAFISASKLRSRITATR